MWAKLDEIVTKYRAIEQQLADPAVASQAAKYTHLAKEHAALGRTVKPYLEYQELDGEIKKTENVVAAEQDAEMRQYVEEALKGSRPRRDTLSEKLEDLLLVDPSADFDSVILEIRAGVGGDEAALFAADLFRMYRKYAEDQGWKVEEIDFSGTELGGFKQISVSISGDGVYRQLRYETG